jgi:hypothetical protein
MAREYGLTQKERDNFSLPNRVYSSFGRDINNDFLMLHVYDTGGNLLVNKVLALDEVDFVDDGKNIDINVGQHLRDLGFRDGEYDVTYKFLRRLAGRERPIYVDSRGIIYTGEVKRIVEDGKPRFYKSKGDETNSANLEEIFVREQKYILTEIAPDRDEFKLELDNNISYEPYRNEFVEMGELIQYSPTGKAKFDSKNPHILEFEIKDTDRGFTQNMVGGQIVIPNMYKVTGVEDFDNSDLPDDDDGDDDDTGSTFVEDYNRDNEVPDYTNQQLIEYLRNGTEEEQFAADNALQDRAQDSN